MLAPALQSASNRFVIQLCISSLFHLVAPMMHVSVLVVMMTSVEHTMQPILDDWVALEPRPMEAQAAHKDFFHNIQ